MCSWFCFTGLLLGAGLLFFFVKYKNLQKNFSKLHEKEHDEDEMTVYHEDMQAGNMTCLTSSDSCCKILAITSTLQMPCPLHSKGIKQKNLILWTDQNWPITTKLCGLIITTNDIRKKLDNQNSLYSMQMTSFISWRLKSTLSLICTF